MFDFMLNILNIYILSLLSIFYWKCWYKKFLVNLIFIKKHFQYDIWDYKINDSNNLKFLLNKLTNCFKSLNFDQILIKIKVSYNRKVSQNGWKEVIELPKIFKRITIVEDSHNSFHAKQYSFDGRFVSRLDPDEIKEGEYNKEDLKIKNLTSKYGCSALIKKYW